MFTGDEGGKITIRARRVWDDLVLEVMDDGPGLEIKNSEKPAFTGLGIANTMSRLEELYGDQHVCRFLPVEPHGLKVEIKIPFVI